jgi:tetratricopeptide (TPR) repeat protein/serine/threonine protein kinase
MLNPETVFAQAIEIETAEDRASFLDQACRSDPELRREVEKLVADYFRAGSFLERPAAQIVATVDEPVSEGPGRMVGPYKLLEQIGEGGFGVVFMAEQQEPIRRKVALKVLKPGMDSKQVIARFEAERQALALMDHANIAKVLDAGQTTSGRPYFVMDLVKGLPITDYCDHNRLTPRERLELFVHVCQAVQHAHLKGIIHRDLKPSNVLVTVQDGRPLVKVIDFGIAKALGQQLTDKTVFTGFAQLVGTPLYMSPEQAALSNVDVDTRSDVYSLGVLLYELLTGTTPFDEERLKEIGYDELRRIIREEDPPRPSTRISTLGRAATTASEKRQSDPHKLSRLFRGELDWIVMKCLEKDRDRRYETASSLARDVERYLHDEPVRACPPSAAYRLRKFVRRHKAALAVAGLVLLVLVLLGSGLGWLVRDRTLRRERAVLEATAAREDVAHLRREGRWTAALAVARRAEMLLAGAGAHPELRHQLSELGRDLKMAADLEEIRLRKSEVKDGRFDLQRADGEYAEAFRSFGIDVEKLAPAEAAEPIRSRSIREELAAALDDWAAIRALRDRKGGTRLRAVARAADPDPWRNRLRTALDGRQRKGLEELAAAAKQDLPSSTAILLASALRPTAPEAALAVLFKAQRKHPDDLWLNHELAYHLQNATPARLEDAVRFYTAALALRPQSSAIQVNLGAALRGQGKLAEAVEAYRSAINHQPDSAMAYYNLGNALQAQGKLTEAIEAWRTAIKHKPNYAAAYNNLGVGLRKQGKLTEAIETWRTAIKHKPDDALAYNNLGSALLAQRKVTEAIAAYRTAVKLDPEYAAAHFGLGNSLAQQGKPAEAITACRTAIKLKPDHAHTHYVLANALRAQGKLAEAVASWRTAIKLDPNHANAHYNLGLALHGQGNLAEAVELYWKAIKLRPNDAEAYSNLGLALQAQGKQVEAIEMCRRAIKLKPDLAEAHYNLGNALRAQGKPAQAVEAWHAAIQHRPDYAEAYCNIAGVLQEQGRFAEAVTLLARGHEFGSRQPGWRYPSAEWLRKGRVLAGLDARLPRVLAGKEKPADAADDLLLARFCQEYKKRFAAAARFYAAAFGAQPGLADQAPHRYNAACAAALAGSGQGTDADKLNVKDRAGLRRQALSWLRADLTAWGRLLENEPDQASAARITKFLRSWLADSDLAAVRGPKALAQLPEAERQQWRQLWKDVGDQLKNALGKTVLEKK